MQTESAPKAIYRDALLATALIIAVVAGGCAGVTEKAGGAPEKTGKAPLPQPAPVAPSPPAAQVKPPEPAAPKSRIGTATPIPGRPLSVRSECTARDATGYTESIKLAVDQGRVGLLEAKITIPRRGSCGFHLSDFRQTRTEPHVELKSSHGTMCTIRMWQQEGRFTVAFSECQEKCTRGAFDYVWPMQVKMADGSCL